MNQFGPLFLNFLLALCCRSLAVMRIFQSMYLVAMKLPLLSTPHVRLKRPHPICSLNLSVFFVYLFSALGRWTDSTAFEDVFPNAVTKKQVSSKQKQFLLL